MIINSYLKLHKTLLWLTNLAERVQLSRKNYFIAETCSFLGFTGVVS
jgi:hypothetical protein